MMVIDDFIYLDCVVKVNIKLVIDVMVMILEVVGIKIFDFNKGNIKVCEWMIVQYVIVGEYYGVVVGIDYVVEVVIGFYIKYGDGGVDVMLFF